MVIASYPDWRQDFFNENMSPRNKEYCKLHDFEYLEITEKLEPIRGRVGWIKAFKVQELLKTTLKDGDVLTCLDADMAIVKKKFYMLLMKINLLLMQLILEILIVWDLILFV